MALASVTTTFNVHDYFGADVDPRRVKAWATTNVTDQKIDDTSTGESRIGSGNATIAADGTGTFTHWAPGADGNPISWQTTYHFNVPDRNADGGRRLKSFGPYTVTTSGLLTALEEEQGIPPEYVTTVTTALDALVTDAEGFADDASDSATAAAASAALAHDISMIDTSDDAMTVVDADDASDFRAQQDERLAANFARGVSVLSTGATGDGTTDDSVAIRAAVTAAAAFGADVYFPDGTYIVSRVDVATAYALGVPMGQRWYGPGTIKLAASQLNFTRVLFFLGDGCTIDGLTIDGNGLNQGTPTNQRHGVFLDTVDDCAITDCTITNCDGDGITLNIAAHGTQITNNRITANLRSGIALVGASNNLLIEGNTITGNTATPIDGETNASHADDVRVIGNYLVAPTTADIALTAAGAGPTFADYNNRWVIMGNHLSGTLHLVGSINARVIGNTIVSSGTTISSINASQTTGTLILGNYIRKTGATTPAILCQAQNSIIPTTITVANNHIESENAGVSLKAVLGASVVNNIITGLPTCSGSGVLVQATGAMTGIVVQGNTIKNFLTYAVQVTHSSQNITGLVIRDNLFWDDQGVATMTSGIRLQGTPSFYSNVNFGDNVLLGGTTLAVNDATTGPVPNGSNNLIRVLATVPAIDAKTTGTTTLYTVPSGRRAVITGAIIRCSTATAVSGVPTLGIGVAAGEDDIFPSTALTGFDTTSEIWRFIPSSGLGTSQAAAAVIKLGIDTGSTGTTHTIAVDLLGYLI